LYVSFSKKDDPFPPKRAFALIFHRWPLSITDLSREKESWSPAGRILEQGLVLGHGGSLCSKLLARRAPFSFSSFLSVLPDGSLSLIRTLMKIRRVASRASPLFAPFFREDTFKFARLFLGPPAPHIRSWVPPFPLLTPALGYPFVEGIPAPSFLCVALRGRVRKVDGVRCVLCLFSSTPKTGRSYPFPRP